VVGQPRDLPTGVAVGGDLDHGQSLPGTLGEKDALMQRRGQHRKLFELRERGMPMTKESFGNWFRDTCQAAGVSKSAHGLRKAGATRAANNGATVAQLEAIFGWKGGGMASLYTRSADRAKLSRGSISLLSKNGDRTTTFLTSSKGEKPKRKNGTKSDT
jgi:hypothetical protein